MQEASKHTEDAKNLLDRPRGDQRGERKSGRESLRSLSGERRERRESGASPPRPERSERLLSVKKEAMGAGEGARHVKREAGTGGRSGAHAALLLLFFNSLLPSSLSRSLLSLSFLLFCSSSSSSSDREVDDLTGRLQQTHRSLQRCLCAFATAAGGLA